MNNILNGNGTKVNGLTDQEKIEQIQFHFKKIMQVLNIDLSDDSLRNTPERVAEMYVNEIFSGLDPANFPDMTTFENTYNYEGMLLEKNITLYSYCAHHFVPIIGKAHVAYFPSERVIGLSKINRLVRYFAHRPQIQEKLTMEIADTLGRSLQTEDVAVFIEADHLCVASRGVKDTNSVTRTSYYGGKFRTREVRQEFLDSIK